MPLRYLMLPDTPFATFRFAMPDVSRRVTRHDCRRRQRLRFTPLFRRAMSVELPIHMARCFRDAVVRRLRRTIRFMPYMSMLMLIRFIRRDAATC